MTATTNEIKHIAVTADAIAATSAATKAPIAGEIGPPREMEAMPLDVVISTGAIDREGDVLMPGGCQYDKFMRNPVVLWGHDQSNRLPIGKVVSISAENDRVTARVLFNGTPLAQEVERLYRERWCRGWSVGFVPLGVEEMSKGDKAEMQSGGYTPRFRVTAWELVELSAVAVPANPEALSKALDTVTDLDVRDQLIATLVDAGANADVSADASASETSVKPKPQRERYAMNGDGLIVDANEIDQAMQESATANKTPSGLTIRSGAFSKSIAEAVTAGKVPTTRKQTGDNTSAWIVFEVMQKSETEITEARILETVMCVPAAVAPPDAPAEKQPPAKALTKQAAEALIQRGKLTVRMCAVIMNMTSTDDAADGEPNEREGTAEASWRPHGTDQDPYCRD